MQYKHRRQLRYFVRSFLYFVFGKCGRYIVRHILPVFLCCLVVALPATVQSFAASETTYSIRDFEAMAFTTGTGSADYSSTIAYHDVSYQVPEAQNFPSNYIDLVAVYNTDSNFYAQGLGKNEWFFTLTNLSLEDEYNLQFFYSIMSEVTYSMSVDLLDSSGNIIANVYTANHSYQTGDRVYVNNCNVNFTLKNLGVTSNQGIKLLITATVPSNFSYAFQLGFSDIVFTNLDDDAGLLDSILNWLSRIYHSIAGGTDREGVTHEGLVQGIISGLNSLGTRIGNFFADLKQGFLDKLEAVKNSINNAIAGIQQWFIDLKDNLINGLKSLFIPSEGYFASKKTQLEQFMTEHFGALYQGPSVLVQLLRKLLDLHPVSPSITFPAIKMNWQGEVVQLTDDIVYSFEWLNDSSHPVHYIWTVYRGFATVMLFVAFVNYLKRKYETIFGGGEGAS